MPRTRLFETLDRALADSDHGTSVVLVCAPAGAGKTTFLADWAHRTRAQPGRPAIAWATVDEQDNERPSLQSKLVQALRGTEHHQVREICEQIANPTPVQPFPLASRLTELTEPVWLILDDAHLLHDPVVLSELEVLLRAPPERVRVVVCGRFEPPLAFQKLRLDGRMVDVTFDDLAFTPEEATALLAEHDVELDPDNLSALMERTEGWAAGLRLAGMSLAEHDDPASLLENFTGCQRAVADYLMEQVLDGQSEEVRQFLVKTSVPATFSAALAEELTGRADAHAIIDVLEHRNFLISRIETSPTQFRYHPLLRSYLRAEIGLLGRQAVAELEHVTARWYARLGDALPALEHGIAADAVSDVESVLSDSGLALVLDGHAETVGRLLADAPRPIRDRPIARLVRVAAHLRADNPTIAGSLLSTFDDHGGTFDDHGGDESAFRTTLLADTLRLQLAVHTGDLEYARTRPVAADGDWSGDPHLDAFAALQRGLGHLHLGRLGRAEHNLDRARTHAREINSPSIEAQTSTALGVVALSRGLLDDALLLAASGRSKAAASRQSKAAASRQSKTAAAGRSGATNGHPFLQVANQSADSQWTSLLEAFCHYLRNDTERAVEVAGAPYASNASATHEIAVAAELFGLDTAPNRRAAVSALHAATTSGRAAHRPPGLIAVTLPSIQFAYLHIGETTWARELFTSAAAVLGQSGDVALLESVLLLYANQLERARAALRPVLEGNLPCAAATNMVTAWLVEAELSRRRFHDARIHDALGEALRLAEPEGVLRPFHYMPSASRELLSASRGRFGSRGSFADRVWASLPKTAVATTEKLTRRELQLLAELPTWRTAEEIAADLCVSVNTVKTHLRGIYRKLGVTTRRDAVTAARSHGLL
ncbi:LuxR C-terminal-related transcriptional regulator [Rhodococcus spongiicola]|uniref:LuxR C-terminal-related transcriptional regulator n=1 Tax=Rhodococcus spongiicola TaxID=2487352 RepID=UPI001F47AE96|nr:LuxR C-terminal-related transcriptional regulator [Rhodococcus spongiicola]